MTVLFYLAAAVAVASTALVISVRGAVHALLYLVVSFLALAVVFYTLGAPFIAALEVVIYAGAIAVLFVFAVTLLNLGAAARDLEAQWLQPRAWFGPLLLSLVLGAELSFVLARGTDASAGTASTPPRQVGILLYGPYAIGLELASLLLLAGLVGAFHLGRRRES